MLPLSVMAIFCEDIREEKGDTATLVGVLPDNVQFQPPPGIMVEGQPLRFMSKLCVYVRINFDPEMDIGVPQISMLLPNSQRIPLGVIDAGIVETSKRDAKEKENLLAGVISRITLAGFQPPHGSIRVEVDLKGEVYVAGSLRFTHPSATVSLPPAEQSPPAAS